MVVLAILVKVKMPGGPAFFCQKRVGKDGKYYYEHYSFWKDIKMIFATVLGKKIVYAGEEI